MRIERELPKERLNAEDGVYTAMSSVLRQNARTDANYAADIGQERVSSAGCECGGSDDQVSGALKKIRTHIGVPAKFKKASGLLRQLFDGGHLLTEHSEECFMVLWEN